MVKYPGGKTAIPERAKAILKAAESFPMLLHALATKFHDGVLWHMHRDTGVPYTTLQRWERGHVRAHKDEVVKQIADHYDLDFDAVQRLISRDTQQRLRSEKIPAPDVARRRGPVSGTPGEARTAGRRTRGGGRSRTSMVHEPRKAYAVASKKRARTRRARAETPEELSLFERLRPFIGSIDTGGARLSENTGEKFRALLLARRRRS